MKSREFRDAITNAARLAEPVVPRCPHAVECGGCAFQDRAYAGQVEAKQRTLRKLFAEAGFSAPLEVVASPEPYEYRTRMDYVSTRGRFGLRMRGRFNRVVELETCHLIPPAGFLAAKAVWLRAMELGLPDYNMHTHEGLLRYVVVRRSPSNEYMLAAVTAAGGDEEAMAALAATALAQPGVTSFHWLLNDTMTDLSFGTAQRHWGAALLPMEVEGQTFHLGPNIFFQNNVHLLHSLLHAVTNEVVAAPQGGLEQPHPAKQLRVADLYGGVGLIGLHLARHVHEVVTVEAVGESADLARHNITFNGQPNISSVAADVADYLRDTAAGRFDVVVVDPPRVGLGPAVSTELLRIRPPTVVYVSCNPLTLLEDLRILAAHYQITLLQGYDMFPHTPHVEMLAVLRA